MLEHHLYAGTVGWGGGEERGTGSESVTAGTPSVCRNGRAGGELGDSGVDTQ